MGHAGDRRAISADIRVRDVRRRSVLVDALANRAHSGQYALVTAVPPAGSSGEVNGLPSWRWREVAEFLSITFLWTWSLHGALVVTGERFSVASPVTAILYLPGLLAPSAAAVIVEARRAGRAAVRDLVRLASPSRVRRSRLVVALAVQPLLTGAAFAISGASAELSFDIVLAIGQVWVVAGEEFGWRGWLWPRAANRFGLRGGTAFVTAVWGLWHLPMFAVAGSSQAEDGVVVFAAAIAAWGAIHGVLQRGALSIAIAMVFHAMTNITVSTVDVGNQNAVALVYASTAVAVFWWVGRRRPER